MKLRTLALAGVAAVVLAGPAAANPQGWYFGLGAGWDNPNNGTATLNTGGKATLGLKDTAAYLGDIGYKWGDNWRVELELNYSDPDVGGKFFKDGELQQTALFVNAAYDIPVGERFNITLGGGAGWGWNEPSSFKPNWARGVQSSFVWQGIAGLSFALSEHFELQADYRYVSFNNTNHGCAVCAPGVNTTLSGLQSNRFMLGFRWYLHAPEMAPPPPPPPPPPPMVKTFIVFFDFDKANLTEEAQKVVAEAVDTAKKSGMVRVLVTGHTDTVGSKAYNQGLSERRAASVKAEMVRLGLGADEITTVGKNFSEPLVPTGPGVREPQNRRAVIDLGS